MESNYRNREFEQYVKENADQYRMFPSEKVWKNIHGTLHTRRRWYGVGLALLLLLTGTAVTWVMVSYPVAKNQKMTTVPAIEKKTVTKPTTPATISDKVLPFSNSSEINKIHDHETTPVRSFNFITTIDEPATEIIIVPAPPADVRIRNERAKAILAINSPKTALNKLVSAISSPLLPFDSYYETEQETELATDKNTTLPADLKEEAGYALNIENVTNGLSSKKIRKRISWQLFVTPTISYRKLDENKSFDNPLGMGVIYPFASLTDVNKAVTHKPDMGLQVGVSARYPVTRNFKLRAGMQFNINRYDIKAFANNPEVATINLNTDDGMSSVAAWTPYRNYDGYRSNWLKNYYFSVSAPIGAEVILLGNSKTNFGIAGTIQPTYIIRDRAYLLSTDYKNYAKVPWLTRHMNVNTCFETFVNYTSGKTKWQVGPQVRYQILSSFNNKYPVRENLFDFGIKVGVTLNE